MKYCFDTDIIVEFFRGNDNIVGKVSKVLNSRDDEIYLSTITLCELYRGAYLAKNTQKELEKINILLQSFKILHFSLAVCKLFGKISASLVQAGKMVGEADLLIGVSALERNYVVVTNNTKHFTRIPNLKIENWL